MDFERFENARKKVLSSQTEKKGIGTLGEKTLHAVLKEYYEPDVQSQEVKIGDYVADIVGEHGIIEIQTRGLSRLKPKLECFLQATDVTVVHPVPFVKYVSWLNEETGDISKPRKSTKKYDEYTALWEMYGIKEFIKNPRFHLVLCMMEIEEIRSLNGWSKDKKRGSTRFDQIPRGIISEIRFETKDDYWQLLPIGVDKNFTTSQLAKVLNRDRETARELLHILESAQIVQRTGKEKNSILYSTID